MGFAEDIELKALPIRQAILSHPFIIGVGDGTLPVEKFKHYMTQDYVYLIDYARVLALASARSPGRPVTELRMSRQPAQRVVRSRQGRRSELDPEG